MTYDELIALYPFVDLFLELFKGLAPTIVAVLAIIINNSIAVKRDKRANVLSKNKKINEGKIAVLNEMLHKHIELSQLRSHILDSLELIKDTRNRDEILNIGDRLKSDIYLFKDKVLEISDYNYAMVSRYDLCFDINKTVDEAVKFMDEVISISIKSCELYSSESEEKRVTERNIECRIEEIRSIKFCTINMIYLGMEIKKLYEE